MPGWGLAIPTAKSASITTRGFPTFNASLLRKRAWFERLWQKHPHSPKPYTKLNDVWLRDARHTGPRASHRPKKAQIQLRVAWVFLGIPELK